MGPHLNIAWGTVCSGDHTKQCIAGTAAGSVRMTKIRMIECVKRINLHADAHLVMNLLRLGQRDVGVNITRGDGLTQARVADLIERRCGEAAGIKPFRCPPERPHGGTDSVGTVAHAIIQIVRG